MTPYTSTELQLLRILLAGLPGDTDYPIRYPGLPDTTVDVPRLRTKLSIHLTRELSRELQNKKGPT